MTVIGLLTCHWCPATPLSAFDLRVLREIKYGRSPAEKLGWYSVSLGVFPVQISTQTSSQCNINELSDLCATGKNMVLCRRCNPKAADICADMPNCVCFY